MYYWIIQENTAKEERYQDFIDAVERSGDDFSVVKVVPFSHELEPPINPPHPVMVYGSMTLTQRIAPKHGWITFTNENFEFSQWKKYWGDNLLNVDSVIGSFRTLEIPDDYIEFFIRPIKDNKAFSGMIMDRREYQNWLGRLFANEQSSDLDFSIDEVVMVSPLKNIQQEIRFFIIGGEIVTHSTYKSGRSVSYFEESMTNQDAIDFVQRMIDTWQPHEAFVLDIAMVDDEYKIIEVNCLNSAGLYKSNVFKIVDKLRSLEYGR